MKFKYGISIITMSFAVASCSSAAKYATPITAFGATVQQATNHDSEDYRQSLRSWRMLSWEHGRKADLSKWKKTDTAKKREFSEFVCVPLGLSIDIDNHRNTLAATAATLSNTAAASPTSLVGLVGSLASDREFYKPTADEKDTDRQKVTYDRCATQIAKIFDNEGATEDAIRTADDLFEGDWQTLANSGGDTSLTAVIAGISAVRGLLVRILNIADQAKREAQIEAFFRAPPEGFLKSIVELDEAAHSSDLIRRIQVERAIFEAWEAYRAKAATGMLATNLDDRRKLHAELTDAAANFDAVFFAIGLEKQLEEKDQNFELDCTPDEAPRGAAASDEFSCDVTTRLFKYETVGVVGRSLFGSLNGLQRRVKGEWSQLTDEEKQAEIEALFGFLDQLSNIINEISDL